MWRRSQIIFVVGTVILFALLLAENAFLGTSVQIDFESYKGRIASNAFINLDDKMVGYEPVLRYLDLQDPANVTKIESVVIGDLVIASAVDIVHAEELRKKLCRSLTEYRLQDRSLKKCKLIVFLLDELFNASEISRIKEECPRVKIRFFPFDLFPKHVRFLGNYSFKPILIALLLKEFRAVYWMDSSIDFKFVKREKTMKKYLNILKRKNLDFAFGASASHSILAATHPQMFNFLNMRSDKKCLGMKAGGVLLVIATRRVKRTFLLRVVQCAILPECIAPEGSQKFCNFSESDRISYTHCHRFDQSAMAIVANVYHDYNIRKFYIRSDNWFRRFGPQSCLPTNETVEDDD